MNNHRFSPIHNAIGAIGSIGYAVALPWRNLLWAGLASVLLLSACLPSASRNTNATPAPTEAKPKAAQPRQAKTTAAASDIPLVPVPEAAKGTTTAAKLKSLGGKKCKDSDFTCVTLSVPLNHFAKGGGGEQIKVMFAVWLASGQSKGLFVTAVGGPGGSGISEAETRANDLPASMHKNFDVVLFDPRGIGRSGYMDCSNAYNDYDTPPAISKAQEDEIMKSTQTFIKKCLREMKAGDGAKLPFYATKQVVQDLEFFRALMGAEKFWLLGESYGTQLAQTYAAMHPDRLAALVLDGPVDLQHPGFDFLEERSRNYSDLLEQTATACQDDQNCANDAKQDLLQVYDALIKSTDSKPIKFKFPDENGELISQQLTRSDIESAISDAVGSEGGRMLVQRMLAAASRGNYIPLGRGAGLPTYPDTSGEDATDASAGVSANSSEIPGDSDAMYYGVDCADNPYFPGTADERAKAYLKAGDAIDTQVRFSRYAYQNFVCTLWPHAGEGHYAFDPKRLAGVPTLVIGATGDSNTPAANAERVRQMIDNADLIMYEGGEHVMFSRGEKCIDDAVVAFLVKGKRPAERVTACPGQLAETYVALAPDSAKRYRDALEAMRSFEDQIFALPEYLGWEGNDTVTVGCDAGGTLTFSLNDNEDGDVYELDNCAFAKGFALSGRGTYDTDSGKVTFTVDVDGDSSGNLSYTHADGVMRVNGKLNGNTIKIKRDDP